MMKFSPYILGSGKAAQAMAEALKIIATIHPDFTFSETTQLKRAEDFPDVTKIENPLLLIANPHALHAAAIIDGEKAGFKFIVTEKPAATNLTDIERLRDIEMPVAVCHGYRQMWGMQTLRDMIQKGEFGDIISLEGRYWQSSSAEKAIAKLKTNSWKNSPDISGPADVLLDLATHWIDAAIFLAGESPKNISLWKSYLNAEASHRDTHIQLTMEFPNTRAMASVSKTVHGAPNHFEMNVIGTKKYGAWKFLESDILEVSEGSTRSFITRKRTDIGSGHWPHHSLGWLEGYVEVIYQYLKGGSYPTLKENLEMLNKLQHTY